MTQTASKLLTAFLNATLASPLTTAGFKRQGRIFRRVVGEAQQIVDIQLWKYNDARSARFTLELGVCYPLLLAEVAALPQFAYFRPQLAKPSITECIERTRIGMLFDEVEDHWWSVETNPASVPDAQDIIVPLMSRGLPWLQRYSSLAEICHAGTPGDGVLRIAACARLGLHNEARAAAMRLAERLSFGQAEAAASLRDELVFLIGKLAQTSKPA